MRLWTPALDMRSANSDAVLLQFFILFLRAAWEAKRMTLPVTMTLRAETKAGATKFMLEIDE